MLNKVNVGIYYDQELIMLVKHESIIIKLRNVPNQGFP